MTFSGIRSRQIIPSFTLALARPVQSINVESSTGGAYVAAGQASLDGLHGRFLQGLRACCPDWRHSLLRCCCLRSQRGFWQQSSGECLPAFTLTSGWAGGFCFVGRVVADEQPNTFGFSIGQRPRHSWRIPSWACRVRFPVDLFIRAECPRLHSKCPRRPAGFVGW